MTTSSISQVVESYSSEMRARLLQFVTGSSRVPLQGFKALQGNTGGELHEFFLWVEAHLIDQICSHFSGDASTLHHSPDERRSHPEFAKGSYVL